MSCGSMPRALASIAARAREIENLLRDPNWRPPRRSPGADPLDINDPTLASRPLALATELAGFLAHH